VKFKMTASEKNWILYDVANSAFILLLTTIMPVYYSYLAENEGISGADYLAYWGYAAAFATIMVAFMGPVLGAFADNKNYKKRLFLISVIIGSIACVAQGLVAVVAVFLVFFIIAKISCSLSLIFYDSMLVDITEDERMDKISSMGYAFGYIGSCFPFLLSLIFIMFYKKFGISFEISVIIAFSINAIWWFLFSLPLVKSYGQKYYRKENKRSIKETLKEIHKDKRLMYFFIGFFFYIDGVYTIIDLATVFGKSLGLSSNGLLLALLLTQLVAFPFALLFGKLTKYFTTEKLISFCILGYAGIGMYAVFLGNQLQFFVFAICVGMLQGGIQALSRSYFAKIIPKEKSGEYFGILDICGKGAAFLGVTLVSVISQITRNQNIGVMVIPIMIIIGFIFFRYSLKKS